MRPSRLLLPACAALLLSAGTAAAQAAGTHGQHHPTPAAPQHQGEHHPSAAPDGWTGDLPAHFEGIALSAAQKARIVALQKEYHARMDALRDSAKAAGAAADDAALRTRVQGVMAEEHAAFLALLDEAGRKRFAENMAKMHAGQGHDPAAGGHGAHGARRPPRR